VSKIPTRLLLLLLEEFGNNIPTPIAASGVLPIKPGTPLVEAFEK
jgi:hypothetical protein